MPRSVDPKRRAASKASRELAATLEYYREASGTTKAEFAHTLGITPQYLHQLLTGTGNPSLESLEAMADALGLDFTPVFRAPLTRAPVIKRYAPRSPRPSAPEAEQPAAEAAPQRASRSRSRTDAKRQAPPSK